MYSIESGVIHGSSFAVALHSIEFITWRLNEETGKYWVKFHLPSGKEIRIRVSELELTDITDTSSGISLNIKIGGKYELDK